MYHVPIRFLDLKLVVVFNILLPSRGVLLLRDSFDINIVPWLALCICFFSLTLSDFPGEFTFAGGVSGEDCLDSEFL